MTLDMSQEYCSDKCNITHVTCYKCVDMKKKVLIVNTKPKETRIFRRQETKKTMELIKNKITIRENTSIGIIINSLVKRRSWDLSSHDITIRVKSSVDYSKKEKWIIEAQQWIKNIGTPKKRGHRSPSISAPPKMTH